MTDVTLLPLHFPAKEADTYTMTSTHIDVIRAIQERRPVVCSPCANLAGGFDAGYRCCDDGKATACTQCGQVTRPIRNAKFEAAS